jgi:hypothetical protein
MDDPTRGIDIGAKAEIYALMSELVRARRARSGERRSRRSRALIV